MHHLRQTVLIEGIRPSGSGLAIATAVLGARMSIENKHDLTSGTYNVTPVRVNGL